MMNAERRQPVFPPVPIPYPIADRYSCASSIYSLYHFCLHRKYGRLYGKLVRWQQYEVIRMKNALGGKKHPDGGRYQEELTQDALAWARGTEVADEDGIPLKVYRGEHGECSGLIHTRHGAISFGSKEAAESYATQPNNPDDVPVSPRIIEAYLSLKNPVINDNEDPFIDLGHIADILGMEKAVQIATVCDSHIKNTDNWCSNFGEDYETVADLLAQSPEMLRELYVDAYPIFDNHTFVQWFKEAGYDGAIHGGNGETALEAEYKVFSESQIKIVKVDSINGLDIVKPDAGENSAEHKEHAELALSFLDSQSFRIAPNIG
jgi:hypothetical protein